MQFHGIEVLDFTIHNIEKSEWVIKLADGTTTIINYSQALEIGIDSTEVPSAEEQTEAPEVEAPKRRGRPRKV